MIHYNVRIIGKAYQGFKCRKHMTFRESDAVDKKNLELSPVEVISRRMEANHVPDLETVIDFEITKVDASTVSSSPDDDTQIKIETVISKILRHWEHEENEAFYYEEDMEE